METKVFLASLALLLLGFGCGYALGYTALGYILLHIGGLGALGIMAAGAGFLARRKGYDYWRAFLLSLASSILIGTAGAYLAPPSVGESRPAACGGSLSLVVALLLLAIWAIWKRRGKAVSEVRREV